MPYRIVYYLRPNGIQPVAEWLDSLSTSHQAVIVDKIQALEENGLILLGTTMMERIKGNDKDFYELRGGQCRVALCYDRDANANAQ